jgi:hypothetical protein
MIRASSNESGLATNYFMNWETTHIMVPLFVACTVLPILY